MALFWKSRYWIELGVRSEEAARRRSQSALPRCEGAHPEAKKRSRWSLCGGSFPKSPERGKPARPAGSRTYCPPKKSHAKNAKSAKKWKEVGEPGCVSPRNNNKASGITLCPKRAYQNDEAENASWMDSALGVLLDGSAVKEMRKPPKISFAAKAPSSRWIAAVSAA